MKTIIIGFLFTLGLVLAMSEGPFFPAGNLTGIAMLFGVVVYGKEFDGWKIY